MGTEPKISVLTNTNRAGGVDITWNSLKRQTFTDFEWVFNDALYDQRKEALLEYTKNDPRVKHYKQGKKDPKAKTWLAHAENESIRKSKGELIVLLQDYIYIEPTALEKYWYQYQENPKHFVTGVGNQYGKPGKEDVVDLNGMITVFKEPFTKKPEVVVWQDPRMRNDQGTYYLCYPPDWEANFCMAPRKMFYDVGGFDESMDYYGHAWDNVSVAYRAAMLDYLPYIDQTNESFSIRNDDFFDTTVKEKDWKVVADYCRDKINEIIKGKAPIKMGYL